MLAHKEDLMYDIVNIAETIRYCKAHNIILRDKSDTEVFEEFFVRVSNTTKGFREANLAPFEGEMNHLFNAFYVIDRLGEGHFPTENGKPPGSHLVNFFVRLGRRPALTEV
jgi:hypothetical protein